ncbi:PREDICTED: uncharacterized protein LOC104824526 [Tarenaya hassleriana]|uniref:uncharacterized protein LOC104824526 n=1 Tax=Tarenaya hassleriana TaxID=28532 RepID=UPI00053C7816|nr:PREDICTED: uncharacterized protein LOC104824526 [Tarenaya hassleriana]
MAIFDPFKFRHKSPASSPATVMKPGYVLSLAVKPVLAVCSFASVVICFYVLFSGGCSDCYRISGHRRSGPFSTVVISTAVSGTSPPRNQTPEPTDVSHIVFGIGGPPYRISGDTSRFSYTCWYGSRSAIRMARIVKETFELGLKNVRWFVMGDDDTVFFLDNLVTVLNKYDHNQMYYIGGNSESVEQDVVHSYAMAYGGGGIAISYPLATELVRILDGCIDRYASFYGSDQKIQGCISEIGVPMTKELGFHQVDIRGNPFGLLSAHPLAPLVSLHHLDYVDPIFPSTSRVDSLKRLVTSFRTDPNRILQHSFCYDRTRNLSLSISWGYAVQIYPSILTAKEVETAVLTFRSWKDSTTEPFTFDTRPLSDDPCGRPIVYFLDRVYELGSGQTLTTYRKHADSNEQQCEGSPAYSRASAVEFIDVTATKMTSDVWKKAPRRQCCEVISGGGDAENAVNVTIRNCNSFESVSPPL